MSLSFDNRAVSVTRREAMLVAGLIAIAPSVRAAEAGLVQPLTVDHINLRVKDVAKSVAFYVNLFGGPPLRVASIPANPTSPPGEAFYIRVGDSYLVVSPAFAPDAPGLDHISIGVRDYAASALSAKLAMNGIMPVSGAAPRPDPDVWIRDADGVFLQLRSPGGWGRLASGRGALPATNFPNTAPVFEASSFKRISLKTGNPGGAIVFYRRLFGQAAARDLLNSTTSFTIGESSLALSAEPAVGLDSLEIAVKDVSVEAVQHMLSARNISGAPVEIAVDRTGATHLTLHDPDGIAIRLSGPA